MRAGGGVEVKQKLKECVFQREYGWSALRPGLAYSRHSVNLQESGSCCRNGGRGWNQGSAEEG